MIPATFVLWDLWGDTWGWSSWSAFPGPSYTDPPFLTLKCDPTLPMICLYLFIREIIETMPFAFQLLWFKHESKRRRRFAVMAASLKVRPEQRRQLSKNCVQKRWRFQRLSTGKNKELVENIQSKILSVEKCCNFLNLCKQEQQQAICRTNRPQFGVFPHLSSHPHLFHVQDRCQNSEREGLLWVNSYLYIWYITPLDSNHYTNHHWCSRYPPYRSKSVSFSGLVNQLRHAPCRLCPCRPWCAGSIGGVDELVKQSNIQLQTFIFIDIIGKQHKHN